MNHKDRFIATLVNEPRDSVPVVANFTPQVAQKFSEILNLPLELQDSFLSTRISHIQILTKLGNDVVEIGAGRAKSSPTITLLNGNQKDEWGIEYETIGLYSEAVVRPLSECTSVEEVENYVMPDAFAQGRWEYAEEILNKYGKEYGVIGDLEASLFELSWNLVGLEKFLMDLYMEEEYINVLLDKILEYSTNCGLKLIEMGVDMVWTGDDFGTQSCMMVSPEIWKTHFKPRMAKMFKAFKEKNSNIKIAYHSCGSIIPIIDDLVEIGLDFLNPIQPLAKDMNLKELYEKYGDKLGFFGGVDVQEVLPNGSTDQVKAEVKRCMEAAKDGRFIIAPAHNIQPDTPVENIIAFFEAVKEYGKY